MSLDLEQLKKQLDESLDKETTESLFEWLSDKKNKMEEKQCECYATNGGKDGICGAISKESRYICTDEKGHSGNHTACSSKKHHLFIWNNDDE